MGKKSKKSKKQQQPQRAQEQSEDRFEAAETRPQFRPIKKKDTKVVLDERFSSVLTDPRFQLNAKDKYGRKKKKSSSQSGKEELNSFYTVAEEQQEKENDEKKKKKVEREESPTDDDDDDDSSSESERSSKNKQQDEKTKEDDDNDDDSDADDENEDPASRIAYLTAFSRGEIEVSSSSEDDSSSESSDDDDDDDEGEDPVYGTAGVLDPSSKEEEIEISYDSSPYLVVTDLDWEHIRAVDLFVILSSFTPPGAVKRVQVFQSDFGIERMAKDRLYGPSNIWKKSKDSKKGGRSQSEDDDDDDDDSDGSSSDGDEGSKSGSDDESEVDSDEEPKLNIEEDHGENDFDPEKLRAYEASKLKYFFAVVEFTDASHADIAYREVDGHEFEHSSAAIDLRTLPADQVDSVVTDRPMRDEATSVPGGYEPPEFVVSALQQTNVQCTWDQGDTERERKLTKYGSGAWQSMAETDDLKAYLASDGSSDDESDEEMAGKGANMRKLLGLDSGDESNQSDSEDSEKSGNDSDNDGDKCMEIKYMPGKSKLEEKIRSKLESKEEKSEELTPWEKYKEKRRLKRKERRQAARGGRDESENAGKSNKKKDDIVNEPVASESSDDDDDDDDFFVSDGKQSKKQSGKGNQDADKSKQELELLIAGEADEEQERDFDIRGIQRMEKNKGKKLRGSRKRKEDKIAADVSGTDFRVDTQDSRFAAVLEGTDARFGIDKTDPNFKETSGMREILAVQTSRRKKKRRQSKADVVVPDVSAEKSGKSAGSNALSSLVQRLKSNVASN